MKLTAETTDKVVDQFARELEEQRKATPDVEAIPSRLIL